MACTCGVVSSIGIHSPAHFKRQRLGYASPFAKLDATARTHTALECTRTPIRSRFMPDSILMSRSTSTHLHRSTAHNRIRPGSNHSDGPDARSAYR